jgi:hypothetical protein
VISKMMIELAAAFVLIPPIAGTLAMGGSKSARGKMAGGENGRARTAAYLKHKPHAKHKTYAHAKHKPGDLWVQQRQAQRPMSLLAEARKERQSWD